MDCNRDEALRAKSIAESKLEQKDFFGAKKFALKAQALYPELDGISHMLTTLDVYVSAENKISGETDWYGVLAVDPFADDEIIKKQYRKLALMLHPDKNKSVGADGAFQLILEAWTRLSDKTNRLAYNQRRGLEAFHQQVPMHTGGTSAPAGFGRAARTCFVPFVPSAQTSGFVPFDPSSYTRVTAAPTGGPSARSASKRTSAPKTQRRSTSTKMPSASTPTPTQQRTDTFWTICQLCKTQYEYVRIYRNCTLRCCNCSMPFLALETTLRIPKSSRRGPWQGKKKSSDQNAFGQGRNVSAAQKSGAGQSSFQQVPDFGKASNENTDPGIPSNEPGLVEVQQKEENKRRYRRQIGGLERRVRKRNVGDGDGDGDTTTQGNVAASGSGSGVLVARNN